MTLNDFINKVQPHGINNSAPPSDPVIRHGWESKQLYSVFDCLGPNCSVLDYGCGGKGTLQYTLFNHFPNASYYGLDMENIKFPDNESFKIMDEGNSHFMDISHLSNILPKVDCMVLGSVFTHLGLNEIIEVLDKTIPHYHRGFQLCFTTFLGEKIKTHVKVEDLPYDYYWIVVLTTNWIKEYCDSNSLDFVVHPFVHELDHNIPLGLTHQSFVTIKKND